MSRSIQTTGAIDIKAIPPFIASQFTPAALGVIWASLGVGIFGLIYVSGKLTGGATSASVIIWFRYVGGLLTVVAMVRFQNAGIAALKTPQPHIHCLRAMAGGGGGLAAIYAAANMPVVNATAVGLLDGLLIVAFGVLFQREPVTARHIGASGLCLVGALVVILGGHGGGLEIDAEYWLPAGVALLGAVLVAIEGILIKNLARSESATVVLLYVNASGALLFAGPAMVAWSNPSLLHTALFFALGPLAILAQFCNIKAYRQANAVVVGPIRYTWIIFGSIYGWVLFSETPGLSVYVGSIMILAGGFVLARSRARSICEGPIQHKTPQ